MFNYFLDDDGTLDTVISVVNEVTDEERSYRFSDTSEYRDEYGTLDVDRLYSELVQRHC